MPDLDELAVHNPVPAVRGHRAPSRRRDPSRLVICLLAVVFLFAPLVALTLGVRARAFENHTLARFPSPRDGWGAVTDLPTWANDNVPWRSAAVRWDATIARDVFGDDQGAPSSVAGWPQVLAGRDGTLFYGGDMQSKCEPMLPAPDIVAALNRLSTAIRASGRTFVLAVPPDKSDLESALLPAHYRGQECAPQRSALLWPQVAAVPGFLDLRPALERARQASPHPLYMRGNTHWDGAGAAAFVTTLVRRLDPAAATHLSPRDGGTVEIPNELGALQGIGGTDAHHVVLVEPPGVRHAFANPGAATVQPQTYRSAGPPGTLVAAPTLIVGDSFLAFSQPDVADAFRQVTTIHHASAAATPAALIRQIVSARVVVLEMVERDIFGGRSPVFGEPFLTALAGALAARPAGR